ncbi:fused MFS/spermidine synthase [Pendulispora rubella]|uniref:Fused MFS/spermidine synthase n=1 Tax=Pendulispora rubella TaxID=2741070 RepID=A0ABZ2LAZ4_9BACT
MNLSESARSKGGRGYLFVLCFLAGFGVMLLEMCAFRELQLSFGTSIYVTGALLTLVMLALSGGYYMGGRLSRRFGSVGPLLVQLLGATVYVLVTNIWFAKTILDHSFDLRRSLQSELLRHTLPVVGATLVLYAIPMIAFSQVSPYLIKLLHQNDDGGADVGQVAGSLMSISTIGSIAGTLVPSFVLIPNLGVMRTLWVFVLTMLLALLAGAWLSRSRMLVAATGVLLAVGVWQAAIRLPQPRMPAEGPDGSALLMDLESHYGHVTIYRSVDQAGNEALHYMPSRMYIHSKVYPADPAKYQFTTGHLVMGVMRRAKRYLLLGTALGGAVAALEQLDPDARITAVEIDPFIVDLAKQFLPTLSNPNVRFVIDDARAFIRQDDQVYDYVMVDVIAGDHPPAHCLTREFFELLRERLAPRGVMEVNTQFLDSHVRTGLSEDAVFLPAQHLHAALLQAGFASVYQNDFFEHGEVYAFKQQTPHAGLRQELLHLVQDERVSVHLRTSAAVAALGIFPIDERRKSLPAFADDWLPEHRVHLKENFPHRIEMLAAARERDHHQGPWAQRKTLEEISAWHYAEIATTLPATYGGLETYMEGAGGAAYCRDVLRWVESRNPGGVGDLARYFLMGNASFCAKHLESMDEANTPRGNALKNLMAGIAFSLEDQSAEGLPLLMKAIDADL